MQEQPGGLFDIVKFVLHELGGWGALLLTVAGVGWMGWRGGSAFMSLAREFSSGVLGALEGIRTEMASYNERLTDLDERSAKHTETLHQHGVKLDRLQDDIGRLTEQGHRRSI